MKYLSSQVSYFFTDRSARINLGALARYIFFLAALITIYAVLFHIIMDRAEGRSHSWFTGFYWTLTVMTTLGFGDIAFTSDIGRVFSVVVCCRASSFSS
jgi:voltage-gated potassium channel